MSRNPELLETTRDVQPLAEAPPAEVQRAQAERLSRYRFGWLSINTSRPIFIPFSQPTVTQAVELGSDATIVHEL